MMWPDDGLVRGWLHIKSMYFYHAGIQEVLQPYILIYREFNSKENGRMIDVTVEGLPAVALNSFDKLIQGHGLEVYEKPGQSTKDS